MIRAYKYGARTPNAPLLRDQMRMGREYYNVLVEAENARRRGAWGSDEVPPPPHDDCTVKGCKECKEHWSSLRKRVFATPMLDVKPMRGSAVKGGLYWGTYLVIEDAFARACKDRSVLRLVKFRSWRDGGVAAVQIQRAACERDGGASMYRTRAQVDNRTGRRTKHGGRQTLEIRIGSDGRNPIWSEPVRYEQHREAVGRPTWIKISMKYRGDQEVWSVVVTCADVPARPASEEAQRGVVAVDVGFRQVGDCIRIAYARDDRGKVSELLMDARWRELGNRADRIRGHRDDHFNDLKAKEESTFALNKSANGARRKIEKMISEGEEVSDYLREWMHRDRHLSQYEDGCRRRSVNARKDAMRKWARELRRNYSKLVLSKTAVKTMKEKAKDSGLPKPARRQGQNAAPGELLDWLVMVFGRAEVAIIKPIHTTNTCVSCKHVNDHGPETIVVCEECGAALDRDEASTRNMMELWVNGECEKPTARKASARFAKKHKTEDKGDNASPAA